MKMMQISGKVVFENLGTGFWGIVDDAGNQWRPVNMPSQLKLKGKRVRVFAKKVEEDVSIFMWGTPVKIITFHT